MRVSAEVDERTLREIYLPGLRARRHRGAPGDGDGRLQPDQRRPGRREPVAAHDLLREEWGFTGVVVSDWGGVADPVASLEPVWTWRCRAPGAGAPGGSSTPSRPASSTRPWSTRPSTRVLALHRAWRVEPADGPSTPTRTTRWPASWPPECAVLLRNDGHPAADRRRPRRRRRRVRPHAPLPGRRQLARQRRARVDFPLDALRALAAGAGAEVTFAPGFPLDGIRRRGGLRGDAVAAARAADVAVVFAGLAETDESEGFDRTTLDLPAAQVELIRAVAAAAPRTVVVLSHGGVVSLEGWHDDVDAILEGFLLGQAGGSALADLLVRRRQPLGPAGRDHPGAAGRHRQLRQLPRRAGRTSATARASWSATAGTRPSASRPATRSATGSPTPPSPPPTSPSRSPASDTARATVTVTNTGDRAGAHVVQVYVATGEGPVRRPVRELRAFTKVHLAAGRVAHRGPGPGPARVRLLGRRSSPAGSSLRAPTPSRSATTPPP